MCARVWWGVGRLDAKLWHGSQALACFWLRVWRIRFCSCMEYLVKLEPRAQIF